jgi:hypothetical protein
MLRQAFYAGTQHGAEATERLKKSFRDQAMVAGTRYR